jgi:hypothetical protein
MGWRLRRSAKLGPFRLNFGKRGVGVSVGVRGAHMSLSADGRVRSSVGLPGTGISYQQTLGSGSRGISPASAPMTNSAKGCLGCFGVILVGGLAISAFRSGDSGEGMGVLLGVLLLIGAPSLTIVLLLDRSRKRERLRLEEQERLRLEQERQQRWEHLVSTYGEEAARLILEGKPWMGATQAMIVEMLGRPEDVSTKVTKAHKTETWKYDQIAANRYALRVTIEDGVCVGWETA